MTHADTTTVPATPVVPNSRRSSGSRWLRPVAWLAAAFLAGLLGGVAGSAVYNHNNSTQQPFGPGMGQGGPGTFGGNSGQPPAMPGSGSDSGSTVPDQSSQGDTTQG